MKIYGSKRKRIRDEESSLTEKEKLIMKNMQPHSRNDRAKKEQ